MRMYCPLDLKLGFSFSLVLLSGLCLLGACGQDASEKDRSSAERLETVATTFYPTTYFTQRIVGDELQVICPVPADADPIFWKPADADVEKFRNAGMIVVNGASFEKWVEMVSLPDSRVVDTAEGFEKEFLTYEEATTHSHGPQGEHSHAGLDGHTWVDPVNAKRQAQAILEALVSRLPEKKATFEKNFRALVADLDALDASIKEILGAAGKLPTLLASHPAYNYLAKRYAIPIENLDLDPEAMPDGKTMADIKSRAEKLGARAMLWEGTPTQEIAAAIQAQCGVKSFVFSPCEMMSAEELADGEDYLVVMRRNLQALKAALAAD